jgi:iron(III) transport system ATP-binding protein
LVKEVREILKNAGVTSILVTHDEVEAENFADKVGIINKKKLLIK